MFAGVGEYFADAFFVVIDGDIELAAADLYLFGKAPHHGGTAAGADARRIFRMFFLCLRGFGTDAQNLRIAAVVAVDGNAFAPQFPGEEIHFLHIAVGGALGEVYGFGYGVVRMALESGLHTDVPFGAHIMSRHENLFDIFGDLVDMGKGTGFGDLAHEGFAVKTPFFQFGFEDRVDLGEFGLIHHITDIGVGENRFHTAGNAGDDGKSPRWRDGGHGTVALFFAPG